MKQTVKTSRAAGQLEKMFRALNTRFFDGKLPEPVITLKKTPGAYGHITCGKTWTAGTEQRHEINISTATLDRPIEETTATLLHEMCHLYNMVNGIKDTSGSANAYHNKRFKETAESHGLIIEHHAKYGWTITSPSLELLDFIELQGWQAIQMTELAGYDRNRHRKPYTRCSQWQCSQAAQTPQQHPAVDMPKVRNHHPLNQRSPRDLR